MGESLNDWMAALIRGFVAAWPRESGALTKWGDPLVAFARADDPGFAALKQSVSATHALPEDILPGAKSVVAFFVPFDPSVPESNRAGRTASVEWARAYVETNALVRELNARVGAALAEKGFRSSEIPATHNFDERTLMSDWSHRHVARVAGLGSFGLNNMLITDRGICGRLGSIVTDLALEPTGRDDRERCLRKRDGSCGLCVSRCANGALSPSGFDRRRCYDLCLENAVLHRDIGYCDVCGKCCAGLPCSTRSPA